jgi:ADP-dependent NAD(P)H-hydrate dehydratase / NAD(P)H-hydrate epimerase
MTLPEWLEPLLDADQQRALDEWAIRVRGIPGIDLMERAGTGLADLVDELTPSGRVAVVCGKGNNGGDGFVAARLLRERARDVRVLTLSTIEDLRGDARVNAERLPGEPAESFTPAALAGCPAVVDAILGTGFAGPPRESAASAIDAINALESTVVACDVPSGVNGSTGEVEGAAICARATATFGAGKPGLWIAPGKDHAGTVRVIDIDIPQGGPVEPNIGLIGEAVADAIPRRGRDSTKFAVGSVLVCGGSIGLTGAPCMASEGAMRAGAGYVTACVPASLNSVFEARLLEVMTVPLPDVAGHLGPGGTGEALARSERVQAVVLGPGLGRAAEATAFARDVAVRVPVALLLDADGLGAHAGELGALAARTAPTVLTPHAGELGRLLEEPSSEIQAHRLDAARRAARSARAVVVLKGDDTLVADPAGRVGVSRGGASALATAGTGDVLSGVIGAYLAKAMEPFDAACAGVYVHAAAGRLAAREFGPEGVIASDVIGLLPRALPPLRARMLPRDPRGGRPQRRS